MNYCTRYEKYVYLFKSFVFLAAIFAGALFIVGVSISIAGNFTTGSIYFSVMGIPSVFLAAFAVIACEKKDLRLFKIWIVLQAIMILIRTTYLIVSMVWVYAVKPKRKAADTVSTTPAPGSSRGGRAVLYFWIMFFELLFWIGSLVLALKLYRKIKNKDTDVVVDEEELRNNILAQDSQPEVAENIGKKK